MLVENDYLTLYEGEGGRLIMEPSIGLRHDLAANEYEYPSFDEIFEGLDGWMQEWGRELGYTHMLPIFWHIDDPQTRWTWPDHQTRDLRDVWQAGESAELVRYGGQDIEVRGETVYYACGCGEKFAIATAREILVYGINCYGSCGDCGTRYHLQVPALKFV